MRSTSRRRQSAFRALRSAVDARRRPVFESLEGRSLLALVSYWTADNTAADAAGSNHGSLVSGATYAGGQVGQAFSFDGVNDRVQVADSPSLALTQSMTIEGWVKANSIPAQGQQAEIFFRGDDRGGLDPYSLSLQANGMLRFEVTSGTNTMNLWGTFPVGQFVHVACTLDDATGLANLYLNGALVSQTTTTARPFGALSASSNPGIGIGNHGGYPATPHNFPFHGLIDELKIYDHALSLEDVRASFFAAGGLPQVNISDATAFEGGVGGASQASFTVSLSLPVSSAVSVNYATAHGSANSTDYGAASGTLTFAPGETSKVIVIQTVDDAQVEGAETFSVNLSNPMGGAIGDGQGTATIQPSDQPPVISISDATGTEGDSAFIDGMLVPEGGGGLDGPGSLLVGPDGKVYASSFATDSVKIYADCSGAYLGELTMAPGELDGPWALAIGPDGLLYVGARNSRSIVRFDLGTREGEVFVSAATGDLGQPMSLAFDADGHLYATSRIVGAPSTTHPVKKFDGATGAFLGDFVTPGTSGLNNAFGIAFGPDGNLYVGSAASQEIKRFNGQTGAFIDTFVPAGSGGLMNVSQIRFHTDGKLYAASQTNHRILRFNASTGAFEDIYVANLGASPSALAFAPSGELYVGLNAGISSRIARVTDQGIPVTVTLSFPSAAVVSVNYATSNGSAIAGADFVAASGVVTFPSGISSQTIYLRSLNDSLLEPSETLTVNLSSPSPGATVADGQAVVTIADDDTASAVSISDAADIEGSTAAHYRGALVDSLTSTNFNDLTFLPDGTLLAAPGPFYSTVNRYDGTTGALLGQFADSTHVQGPRDILVRDGFVYIASENTDTVARFDAATGAFIDNFVTAGSGGIDGPHGMIFGPDTTGDGIAELYVVGRSSFTVVRYDGATGQPLGSLNTNGAGAIAWAEGITTGPGGTLYVGSTGTNQVQRYDAHTGAHLGTVSHAELSGPKGVRVGPDGLLYVLSSGNNRILRFTAAGAFVDDYVPAGAGGMANPYRFEFGPDGDLYVSALGTNRILRFGTAAELVFTVSRQTADPYPVTVSYATANGSATSGSDYDATAGSITLPAGVTQATIRVPLIDNTTNEPTETFTVNLSNPVGSTILDGQGIGTIVDNDLPPTKFYVVDDASANKTFEYGASGSAVENYNLNSGNSAPRGAASNAAGDKVWVIDNNKTVYVYNNSGGLLGSWSAGSLASNATVQGIATNGTDIWIVDSRQDRVYRYTGAASRLSGSQNAASNFALNSGNKDASDLVTDGTSLWILDNASTDKVFKYTVSGTLQGSWTISSGGGSPTGLTIDPSGVSSSIWIVDSFTDRVYEFTNARSRTSGSQTPAGNFALANGNGNPQGIADPPLSTFDTTADSSSGGSYAGAVDAALLAITDELEGVLTVGRKRK